LKEKNKNFEMVSGIRSKVMLGLKLFQRH